MRLYSLEGNTQKLDGGAMFGHAPKALWSRWVVADDNNRIDMACRCLLIVDDNNNKVLLETGIGAFFEPALKSRYGVIEEQHCLLDGLEKLGFKDSDIDYVIVSHLHFDHAGGLLTPYKEGEEHSLLFPNAKIITGEKQWHHALSPHLRDRSSYIETINSLIEQSGRLHLVKDGEGLVELPYLSFSFTDGHTPGLMITELSFNDSSLAFSSDLIPGQHWVHLPICMGYDRYPELLIEEKAALLDDLLRKGGYLFFTHDADMVLGKVRKDSAHRYFVERASLAEFFNE